MGFIDNPMSNSVIPVAILLGMGEGAAIISSTAMIGKRAPTAIRGTVFGAFAMWCCWAGYSWRRWWILI